VQKKVSLFGNERLGQNKEQKKTPETKSHAMNMSVRSGDFSM